MSSKSIKHHFVPQSLLKQFRINESEDQIYVYDKRTMQHFKSAIVDAGSENHFNTIELNGIKINLEDVFKCNDEALSSLIARIITEKTIANLSPDEMGILIQVVATQVLRVKMIRSTFQDIIRNLANLFEKTDTDINLPDASEENAKTQSFVFMQKAHETISKAMSNKDAFLIMAPQDSPFVISDNPVALYNHIPFESTGFSSPGVQVYFPISKSMAIGLFCKSIYKRVKQYEAIVKNIDVVQKKGISDIIDGVEKHIPIRFDKNNVTQFFNCLQADNASRFIYSSSDDFSFRSPNACEQTSKLSVSGIGTAPRNPKMPEGKWFVVHDGYNSVIIPLFSYTKDTDSIVMTCPDVVCARKVNGLQDAYISVFDDGIECLMSRHSNITVNIKEDIATIVVEDSFLKINKQAELNV